MQNTTRTSTRALESRTLESRTLEPRTLGAAGRAWAAELLGEDLRGRFRLEWLSEALIPVPFHRRRVYRLGADLWQPSGLARLTPGGRLLYPVDPEPLSGPRPPQPALGEEEPPAPPVPSDRAFEAAALRHGGARFRVRAWAADAAGVWLWLERCEPWGRLELDLDPLDQRPLGYSAPFRLVDSRRRVALQRHSVVVRTRAALGIPADTPLAFSRLYREWRGRLPTPGGKARVWCLRWRLRGPRQGRVRAYVNAHTGEIAELALDLVAAAGQPRGPAPTQRVRELVRERLGVGCVVGALIPGHTGGASARACWLGVVIDAGGRAYRACFEDGHLSLREVDARAG